MRIDIAQLLKEAVASEASDLHLSVGMPPVMRVAGILLRMGEEALDSAAILEALKVSLPHQHRILISHQVIDTALQFEGICRCRIHIYHDSNGPCVALRIIPDRVKSLQELGIPDVVNRAFDLRQGLVLITGAAGSGKTTTLASLIEKINSIKSRHIVTLEDPIEYVHRHKKSIVNQMELGVHISSFYDGIKSAMRENADIIVVGEMRDPEAMVIALAAAEMGHLVMGTLHAKSSVEAVGRMIDAFPVPSRDDARSRIAGALEMVISQQLVISFRERRRHLACEIMVATPAIRQLIRRNDGCQIKSAIEIGGRFGMQTLEKSLASLVDSGQVSPEFLYERRFNKWEPRLGPAYS